MRGRACVTLAALAPAGIVFGVAVSVPGSRPATLPPAAAVGQGTTPWHPSGWRPPERADWMWELGQPLVTSDPRMMGTGVTAYNGDKPPGDNPVVYDIDGSGRDPCR